MREGWRWIARDLCALVAQIARQQLGADGEYQRLLRATEDAPLIVL